MNYTAGLFRSFAFSIVFALLFALLPASSAHAQGVKIRAIEVQYTGPETISRERILAQIRTAVGQTYSDAIAEQDIRNLYSTGLVQNVRIFGQQQGDGVKVIVAVQTRGVVNEIEIDGATRLSAKSLRKKIALKVNSALDEDALGKGRQEIIDAYRAKGFNDVDVQYRVDSNQARGTSRVVYTINEGLKGAISRVRFEGNTAFGDRILRKQMKTKGKTLIAFIDKSGRLDESQLQQDLDAIREWYQDHGYIDVEIPEVRRERTRGRMVLVIPISEGPKYSVGRIAINGAKNTSPDKIRALIKLKEGSVYSPKTIREDAKKIADAYGSGGFVDLVIQPQGLPSGPNKIDVTFNIEEGNRSFVQRINIVGNSRTKDKVIRREVLIAPGDLYSTTRVETSKKRLDNLGYFSRVEAYPEETGVPGRKDLTVQVEEKRTGALNFGAGFSTIDSIVGFVEVSQGNFDIMNWPNFTGAGQKFRMRIQYGGSRKDIVVALTEPYFLDRRLSLGGEIFYREANFLSSVYDQRNYGFSIVARRALGRFMSGSVEYRLEEIEIFNVDNDVSELIGLEEGTRTKSQITTSFVFDTRDNPFLTHRGQRVILTPFISGGFLGGDTQLFGFELQASQYFTFPYDLILLLNAEIASVDTWGEGERVPIFDRLFLGGPNNLRGFEYRDVGPKDENGEPLGGKTLARATVELTFPIVEKVRGAVFYDIGFVEPKAFNAGGRAASDVGLGLRLDLPIGPLRLDYGYPIQTGGNNNRSGKFNFNVGYQF
ncbi:MAG: outer membrane protein assembly factor BamA [Chthoniobacterales bacterium]|nr:outer membrane protein assembly factor BamA [Chthoniobacterales bacterium]